MPRLNSLLLKFFALPGVTRPLGTLTRGRATVFAMHRFRDGEYRGPGCEPAEVRHVLAFLRREKFDLVSVDALFARLRGEGRPLYRTVAFTIDDGYREQATVAAPIFAEFDCPVTTFVVTGFVDRKLWFWWDQIAYVFDRTRQRKIELKLGEMVLGYEWTNASERSRARIHFRERCKSVPDVEKHAAITLLTEAADVDLPDVAPPAYAPMSWDELRSCEALGMSFGAHTVTHPILSRTTDDRSAEEIVGSVRRLRAEAASLVPVFCYPNGRPEDFGKREFATLRQVGIVGALGGEPGYATANAFLEPDGAYAVPRIGYPRALPRVLYYVTGAERGRQLLRSLATR